MPHRRPSTPLAVALALALAAACAPRPSAPPPAPDAAAPAAHAAPAGAHDHAAMHGAAPAPDNAASDTAFARLQARGRAAMGVDQYTSRHVFAPLADGGRIELQRDPADTAGVRTIRAHLREIAAAFARGDFATPGFVHDGEVPGTRVMAARRAHIAYAAHDLPGGGEVRITTRDPEALAAVHAFLAYQRSDHRAH